jgi:hypothetical protein
MVLVKTNPGCGPATRERQVLLFRAALTAICAGGFMKPSVQPSPVSGEFPAAHSIDRLELADERYLD